MREKIVLSSFFDLHSILLLPQVTHLTVDKLDVLRALRVTVPRPVLCPSFIALEPAHPTVLVHLTKVDCAIDSTRKPGHVHVQRELLIQEVEQSILVVAG